MTCEYILDKVEYLIEVLEIVSVGDLVDVWQNRRDEFIYLSLVVEKDISWKGEKS